MDVYRYVLTLGVGPEAAQEVTHDAFLRLFEALREGVVVDNTRAWLLKVAHNMGVNIVTAKSARSEGLEELEHVAQVPRAEERLIEEQRNRRLAEAVAGLSPQQRACLELRAQGLRYREIGDIVGIAPSTVGEFLRRAIARLRRTLDE